MAFKIDDAFASERKISQSVIQVMEMLGMYHAELARVLGKQCDDIGKLTSGRYCIQKGSGTWYRAVLFVDMYHHLFDCFEGDSVAMYHWMRAHNKRLDGTPLYLIVDENQLQTVHDYLSGACRD